MYSVEEDTLENFTDGHMQIPHSKVCQLHENRRISESNTFISAISECSVDSR